MLGGNRISETIDGEIGEKLRLVGKLNMWEALNQLHRNCSCCLVIPCCDDRVIIIIVIIILKTD